MMLGISRRALVVGGVSAAAVGCALSLPLSAQEPMSVEQFRALSARLTGVSLTDLDLAAAARLLQGFVSLGEASNLAGLLSSPSAHEDRLANAIVAAWYSGTFETSAGPASIGLDNALLWDALSFTKPPGLCGGDMGFWEDAPQN